MKRVAEVAVNVPGPQGGRLFSYLIPSHLPEIGLGWRVLVPFGAQKVDGVIVGVANDCTKEMILREIEGVLDDGPWFTADMLETAQWISAQHLCSLAEALRLFIPGRRGIDSQKRYYLIATDATDKETGEADSAAMADILHLASRPQGISLPEAIKRWGDEGLKALRRAMRQGRIKSQADVKQRGQKKIRQWIRLVITAEELAILLETPLLRRRVAQQRLLQLLLSRGGRLLKTEIVAEKLGGAVLNGVLHNHWAVCEEEVVDRSRIYHRSTEEALCAPLTFEQEAVMAAISPRLHERQYASFLLHGVTGSGKTQLYIEMARQARQQERQVIVLVPEIALTDQIVERFRAVFDEDVLVIHSRMSLGERYDAYRKLLDEHCGIVIGPRSVVFAPCPDPGVIILDEEHEFTYKQEERPYYHARSIAEDRARRSGAVLLLGSATPAVETFFRTSSGEMQLLELHRRANPMASAPHIEIVDMRAELKAGRRNVISQALFALLQQTFSKGEQAIVLLNRRGHSTFVMCRECGFVLQCKQCSVSLVHHHVGEDLRCHYCSSRYPIPKTCPKCGSHYIRYFGTGTQKLEQEIKERFPGLRVARMDQDTVQRKGAHERILRAFRAGEADLLLGTQMVAKGHDFGNVTAVGILSIDSILNLPDFRSSERAYALIMQAAGRAGRAEKAGRVIVQTYDPDHHVFQSILQDDYAAFCQQELSVRSILKYPPYVTLAKISFQGDTRDQSWEAMQVTAAALRAKAPAGTEIMDPYVPGVAKIQGRHRAQLLIKAPNRAVLLQLLTDSEIAGRSDLAIDLEPLSLL